MKKLLLTLSLLILPIMGHCEDKMFSIQNPKGMVDKIASDKIGDEYATDALNVNLDDVIGCITKRRGYKKYNTTALTGEQPIRKLYTYKQVDGDEYIIANSSTSVFYSKGDGTFTAIISTLSSSYTCDFATAKDYLYMSNGTDIMQRWDGTTLEGMDTISSTGTVKGRYIIYWNNRLFCAGVDSFRSTVYYSEVGDPEYIDTFNYINVNVSDGENITGMYIWGNALYVFKDHSTWTINEVSAGNFIVRNVSNEIGCLYQDSIAEYKGFMVFFSNRGIELYDGQFNLISETIDRQIKDLRQLVSTQNEWTQTSAEDWGAGSGTNIDTTTYSGSIYPKGFQSRDSSRKWISIAVSTNGVYQTAVNDEGGVSKGYIYVSSDSGKTWTQKGSNKRWNKIDMSWEGSIQYASEEGVTPDYQGYVYKSTDYGQTWNTVTSTGSWAYVATSSAGSIVYAAKSLDIYKSTDSGSNWSVVYSTTNAFSTLSDMETSSDGSVIIGADYYGNEVILSTNSGSSWAKHQVSSNTGLGSIKDVALSSDGTIQTALCGVFDQLYYSSNNWTNYATILSTGNLRSCGVGFDGDFIIAGTLGSYAYVSYDTGTVFSEVQTSGRWVDFGISKDEKVIAGALNSGYLQLFYSTATFVSQTKNCSGWYSWGELQVTANESDGDIAYSVKTSTYEAGVDGATAESVANRSTIISSDGGYIQITANITGIKLPDVFPYISEMRVIYYGEIIPTIGIVYRDAYWLAVATDDAKAYNNMVYRYDKNANWTKYSGMNIGGATISRSKLYTGDSSDVGFVYEQDVADRFYDVETTDTYDSYWQSKLFDMDMPLNDKLYKILYTVWAYEDSTDTPYVSYRMFNDTGTYTTSDVTYVDYGITLQKTPMTHSKRSRYLQLKLGDDSDTDFEIKGIFGLYEVLPIR